MGGRQAFRVLTPRVGARLDGGEAVEAAVVRQGAADTREVRVQRGVVLLALVGVAARRVGLPDLDQLAADRAPVAVEQPAGDRDPLTDRFALVLPGEVVVDLGDVPFAEGGEASSTSSGSCVTSMVIGGCFGWRSTEERYGA